MYDTMTWEYYRGHMETDVYKTVRDCHRCALNKLFESHNHPLQGFSANVIIGSRRNRNPETTAEDITW